MGLFGFGKKKAKAEPAAEPAAAPKPEPVAAPLSLEDARAAMQAALKDAPSTVAVLSKAEGALASFKAAGPSKFELSAFEKQVAKLREAAHRLDPDMILSELEAAQEASDAAALTALLTRAKEAKLDHLVGPIEDNIKELGGPATPPVPKRSPSAKILSPSAPTKSSPALKIPSLAGEANNWEAVTERDMNGMTSTRVAAYRTWKTKAAIARREVCIELLAPVVAAVPLANIATTMLDCGIQSPADVVSVNATQLAEHLAITAEQAAELFGAAKTAAEKLTHELAKKMDAAMLTQLHSQKRTERLSTVLLYAGLTNARSVLEASDEKLQKSGINPYEAKRLQQLLEERPAAPSLASVSEDAVVPDELSSRLRKKTAEVESVLKSIELEPTSLSELLTLQANLRTAKKTTGLDPTRLAAGEQRLTSSAARLMEEEAAKSAPDQDVLADLLAIAKEVGVAAAAMAAAQKVLQRVDAQQTLKSVRMGGLKRGNSSRYDLEAAVKDAEDAGVSKAEVKAGKAALTELKKEMSTMDLKEAKFEREEEIKEAYEKLINDREGLITAEVLADLEALQRAAKRMGSVLNKQKQKQLDTALKGAQDYVKRLGRLCDEADADLIGLDHGLALQLITESREDHDLDEARLLEKKLGRRTALTAHGEELDAAVAKWEAAAASRQAEAVARAHSELSDLLEKVKGEGFERSQSKALAKADDIIREYIEAYAHLDGLVKKADDGAVSPKDLKKALDRAQKTHLPLELMTRALKIYNKTEDQRKAILVDMKDDLMRAEAIKDWIEQGFPEDEPEFVEAKQREDELQTHVKALESAQNYPIDPFALQKAIDKAAHDDVPVEYIDMARDVLQKAKEVKEDLKAALKPKGPPSKTKMLMCMAQAKDELDQIADGEVRMLLEEGELKVKEIDAASEALTTCLKEPPVDEPPWDQKKYDFGTEAYEELATQIISGIQDIEGALEKARDAGIDEESKEMRAVEDMLIRWKELKPRTLMVDTELARVSHDLDGDTSLTTPRPDAPTKLEPGSPTKSDGGSPKSPKFGGRSRKTKEKSFLFWFVRAAKLREMSGQMPKLQELQEREEKEGKGSWLCQIPITEEDAFTNKYAQTILTVSHRWEDNAHPDQGQNQIEKIRQHVIANEAIEYVWVDYLCMYQGARTKKQETEFKDMLPHINLLYLGTSVLVLADNQYLGRFWTQFELWLSFQKCTAHGVVGSPRRERRCTISKMYNMSDAIVADMEARWSKQTCAGAREYLSRPDVDVTNKSDKDVLLPLVEKLDDRVKGAFNALNNVCYPWLELKTKGLVVRHDANQILANHQHSLLNIVAVCGQLRTGKSYLMNCLMESEVFGVSSQAESYTQGIHLSSLLLPCSRFGVGAQEPRVGFVDMEGQSDKGIKYDVKLATPLLIVAKVILLNVLCGAGPPKQRILSELQIMMNAAKAVKSDSDRSGLFGCLHIVLRDCTSTAEESHKIIFEQEDKPIEYDRDDENEEATNGRNERNMIRREIYEAFEQPPQTWVLPKVVVGEHCEIKEMPAFYRDLGPLSKHKEWAANYIEQLDALRAALGQQLQHPKTLDKKPLSAGQICSLMPIVAEALEKDDPNINPASAFEAARMATWGRIEDDIKLRIKRAINDLKAQLPVKRKQIDEAITKYATQMNDSIKAESMRLGDYPDDEKYKTSIRDAFEEIVKDLKETNEKAIGVDLLRAISKKLQPPIDLDELDKALSEAQEFGVTGEDLEQALAQRAVFDEILSELKTAASERPLVISQLENVVDRAVKSGLDIKYYLEGREQLTNVTEARNELDKIAKEKPVDEAKLQARIEAAREAGVPADLVEHVEQTLEKMRAASVKLDAALVAGGVAGLNELIKEARSDGVPDAKVAEAETKLEAAGKTESALKDALAQLGKKDVDATAALAAAVTAAEAAGAMAPADLDAAKIKLATVQKKAGTLQKAVAALDTSGDVSALADLLMAIRQAGIEPRVDFAPIAAAKAKAEPKTKAIEDELTKAMKAKPLEAEVNEEVTKATYSALASAIERAAKVQVQSTVVSMAKGVLQEAEEAGRRLMRLLLDDPEFDSAPAPTEAAKVEDPEFDSAPAPTEAASAPAPTEAAKVEEAATGEAATAEAEATGGTETKEAKTSKWTASIKTKVWSVSIWSSLLATLGKSDDGDVDPDAIDVVVDDGEEALERISEDKGTLKLPPGMREAEEEEGEVLTGPEPDKPMGSLPPSHTLPKLEEPEPTISAIKLAALRHAVKHARDARVAELLVAKGESYLTRHQSATQALDQACIKPIDPEKLALACAEAKAVGVEEEVIAAKLEQLDKVNAEITKLAALLAEPHELGDVIAQKDRTKGIAGEVKAVEEAEAAINELQATMAKLDTAAAKPGEQAALKEAIAAVSTSKLQTVEALAKVAAAQAALTEVEEATAALLAIVEKGDTGDMLAAVARATKAGVDAELVKQANDAMLEKGGELTAALSAAMAVSLESYESFSELIGKAKASNVPEGTLARAREHMEKAKQADAALRDVLAQLNAHVEGVDLASLEAALTAATGARVPEANMADAQQAFDKARGVMAKLDFARSPPSGIVVSELHGAILAAEAVAGISKKTLMDARSVLLGAERAETALENALRSGVSVQLAIEQAEVAHLDKKLIDAAKDKAEDQLREIEERMDDLMSTEVTKTPAELKELQMLVIEAEKAGVRKKAIEKATDFLRQVKDLLRQLAALASDSDVAKLEEALLKAQQKAVYDFSHPEVLAARDRKQEVAKVAKDFEAALLNFLATVNAELSAEQDEDEMVLREDSEEKKSLLAMIKQCASIGINLATVAEAETRLWTQLSKEMDKPSTEVNAPLAKDLFLVYMCLLVLRFGTLAKMVKALGDDKKNATLLAAMERTQDAAAVEERRVDVIVQLRAAISKSPIKPELVLMAKCEEESLLQPHLEAMSKKLEEVQAVKVTTKLRQVLQRELRTVTSEIFEDERQLFDLRNSIEDTLTDPGGTLKDLDDKKAALLKPLVRMFALAIAELSDITRKVHADVKTVLLDMQKDFIWKSYQSVLKTVNDVIKAKTATSDTALRYVTTCWEALYFLQIDAFIQVHNICRDNITTWPHESGTWKLLKGNEADTLSAFMAAKAPAGLADNAKLFFAVRDTYMKLFDGKLPLWGLVVKNNLPALYNAGGSANLYIQQRIEALGLKATDLAAEWAKTIEGKHAKDNPKIKNTSCETLYLVWLHLGNSLLPPKRARGLDFNLEYRTFSQSTRFKDYANFIQASIALESEFGSNPDADASVLVTLARYLNDRLPGAMTLYVDYLGALRELKQKFISSPYSSSASQLVELVAKPLQRFVKATADDITNDDIRHGTHVNKIDFHLDAVQAARDFCTTYVQLDMQPGCPKEKGNSIQWQLEEWRACGELIGLCTNLAVGVTWFWNPRIQALKLTPMVFRYFRKKENVDKDFKLARTDEEEAKAKSYFRDLLEPCRNVYITDKANQYKTTEDFTRSLNRLKACIEFNFAMPQISPDEALDRFSEEINRSDPGGALSRVASTERTHLKAAWAAYEKEYQALVMQFATTSGPWVPHILAKVDEYANTRGNASLRERVDSWDATKRHKLPNLLAVIAFLFSLHSSELIDGDHVLEKGKLPPLRAHCIQIIGILNLFGMSKKNQTTKNQLAEVLTGQGKSWVLVLSALLLALTGKDVRILCHNESLTQRDERAAAGFIKLCNRERKSKQKMGVVMYATYQDTCWSMLDSYGDRRKEPYKFEELIDGVVNPKEQTKLTNAKPVLDGKNTVLLIDEVDVLFGPMYGQCFNPVAVSTLDTFNELEGALWHAAKTQGTFSLTAGVVRPIKATSKDKQLMDHLLFQQHIDELSAGVLSAMNQKEKADFRLKQLDNDPYAVVQFKHESHGQEFWSSKAYKGYANAFHYLRLCGEQGRKAYIGEQRCGYMRIDLGALSYAEVPKEFPCIFGVTGSLSTLPDKQREVLMESYRVSVFSFFPSFWETKEQKRQLDWQENKLTNKNFPPVVNEENEVFVHTLAMIRKIVNEDRAVLVFCKDSRQLKAFKRFCSGKIANPFILDGTDDSLNVIARSEGRVNLGEGRQWTKKDLIVDKQAGEPKAVTIATAEFGRGEDFKYSPSVLEKGGGHAIQLYLTKVKADEIQVRGRVARKNEPGSYSLILSWEEVKEVVGESDDLKRVMKESKDNTPSQVYKNIDALRLKMANETFAKQLEDEKRSVELHGKTLSLLQEVRNFYATSNMFGKTSAETRGTILNQLHTIAGEVRGLSLATGGSGEAVSGIDLCFLLDCTASMGNWIAAAKEQLFKVVANAKASFKCPIRVAYVGYRDFADSPRFDIRDFVTEENMPEMRNFIASSEASGGGDWPEDVAGGLHHATNLSWAKSTPGYKKVTVMIADAPAHREPYRGRHKDSDSSEGFMRSNPEDPGSKDPKDALLALMNQAETHFFFFKIDASTEAMISAFKRGTEPLAAKGLQFKEIDLGGDTNLFVESVQQSLSMSVGVARG